MLAAGAATRFGAPKQWLFLPRVLAALEAAGIADVVVVAGAYPFACDNLSQAPRVVRCEDWERGPGASLRCGLTAVDAEHALVVLADAPELDPRAVERVLAHRRDGDVVAATYDGSTRSHPVAVARGVWPHVPDEGLRALAVTLVDCTDLRPPGDVDFADMEGE